MLLAFEMIDLLAFVALGLSLVLVAAVVLGIGLWLRSSARRPTDLGEYPGL